jgi:hypothetical protein
MNTKEFVTKIIIEPIRSKQRMIRGLSIRKKLVLPGIMALLSLVSGNSIAYAQTLGEQQQQQLADPFVESLNMAKTKVEVATSVGAFGNGVPELYNISVQNLMLVFTITAVGAIVTYIAIKMLLPHFRRMKITLTNIPQTVV